LTKLQMTSVHLGMTSTLRLPGMRNMLGTHVQGARSAALQTIPVTCAPEKNVSVSGTLTKYGDPLTGYRRMTNEITPTPKRKGATGTATLDFSYTKTARRN
jgi:hypothetical protein